MLILSSFLHNYHIVTAYIISYSIIVKLVHKEGVVDVSRIDSYPIGTGLGKS